MDHSDRQQLKNKIDEISRGFESLMTKIDDMPQHNFESIEREVEDFRFRFSKVLNLSPDGEKGEGPVW